MNQNFDLSIVISSYNRDDKVLQTIQRLFESDFSEFQNIELIVIDDGSPKPVENLLPQIENVPPKINLKLVRQANSGIGATRNRGFREAKAEIILFLDDDILVTKDTLSEILRAHRENQNGIFFGSYPFITHETESLRHFATKLFGYDEITKEPKFEKVNAITSGLLSVNKSKLNNIGSLYKDDLTIPAAEEYEIIYRFHKLQISIFHAKHIYAIHNHHLELDWFVQQQYKYGLGTAEAFCKYPEITNLETFVELKSKLDTLRRCNIKNIAKTILASGFGRKILFFLTWTLEKSIPNGNHNFMFGLLASAYYWAGYREGLKRFGN